MADPVSELVGAATGVVNQAATGNTTEQGAQTNEQRPGFNAENLKGSVDQLPVQTKEAQEAYKNIGAVEQEKGVPAAQFAESQYKNLIAQQFAALKTAQINAEALQGHLSAAQTAIDLAHQRAIANPTQEVYKQWFGDHPITSTIAMILGGIGSGLTGQPNVAQTMLAQQIDGATKKKADEINTLMQQAATERGIGQDIISNGNMLNMSNNLASSLVLQGAQGVMTSVANQIGSQTAKDKAVIHNLGLKQAQINTDLGVAQQFKDSGAYTDTEKANGYGLLLDAATNAVPGRSKLRNHIRDKIAPGTTKEAPIPAQPIQQKQQSQQSSNDQPAKQSASQYQKALIQKMGLQDSVDVGRD